MESVPGPFVGAAPLGQVVAGGSGQVEGVVEGDVSPDRHAEDTGRVGPGGAGQQPASPGVAGPEVQIDAAPSASGTPMKGTMKAGLMMARLMSCMVST